MNRRENGDAVRRPRGTVGPADPFLALRADHAWRASDAVDNGANTTSLLPYIGGLTLARSATGQGLKTASATLRGATVIPFNGVAGNAGYTGALAAPVGLTVATVWRCAVTASAAHALTVGGLANTGTADGMSGANAFSQKVATAALKAQAIPNDLVTVSVFTAAGSTIYCNSYTPASAALAGALAGDTFIVGSLSAPGGTFVMNGEWARTGVWLKALSTSQIRFLLLRLGVRHGIAIAA